MTALQTQPSADLSARRSWGKYILAGSIGALITFLAISAFTPATTLALSEAYPSSADGLFAIQTRLSSDTYGFYLIDTRNQSILLYGYGGRASRGLRLLSARSFRYDRQLLDFNSGKPSPSDVRELVKAAAKDSPGTKATDTPAPEKPEDVPAESTAPK